MVKRGITSINKTFGRARDPRANGAWLSKLTESEVFILGGQRIDQKSKKGWRGNDEREMRED